MSYHDHVAGKEDIQADSNSSLRVISVVMRIRLIWHTPTGTRPATRVQTHTNAKQEAKVIRSQLLTLKRLFQ